MEKKKASSSATSKKITKSVLPRKYTTLLKNAGFDNHKHLTGDDFELDGPSVDFKILAVAHRKLQEKKKDENFFRYHEGSKSLKDGVEELANFLAQFKDYSSKVKM